MSAPDHARLTIAEQVAERCRATKDPDRHFIFVAFIWTFMTMCMAYGIAACVVYLVAQVFNVLGYLVAQLFGMLQWLIARYDALLLLAAIVLFVRLGRLPTRDLFR